MSHQFRDLLKKVGSGQHTKKDLTRHEADSATRMMLSQDATPAQIGAFLIAHRIKRPTGIELAGMLDAYDALGAQLSPLTDSEKIPVVFGIPYDGRDRTVPINPITALILAIAGIPVILHGGDTMATKYGIPLNHIWQGLGLDFSHLCVSEVEQVLKATGLTFFYTPKHFPQTNALVDYRDQIGKRPPLATLELIWSPYRGNYHLIAGYVHPPTEMMVRQAFAERHTPHYTLVKGLEGSCDLRLSQTTIMVASQPDSDSEIEYFKLNANDYNLGGKDLPLESIEQVLAEMEAILAGKSTDLLDAVLWNGGVYLWRCGICQDVTTGIEQVHHWWKTGKIGEKREEIRDTIATMI